MLVDLLERIKNKITDTSLLQGKKIFHARYINVKRDCEN